MSRVYNFSAGPAVLPEAVLKEVADEMMDYQGSGMSVMEMSHRSPDISLLTYIVPLLIILYKNQNHRLSRWFVLAL